VFEETFECHKIIGKWPKKSNFAQAARTLSSAGGVLLWFILNIENITKATHCREAGDRRQKKNM
jgi:hypothetical protein